jgi:hypothetical protein
MLVDEAVDNGLVVEPRSGTGKDQESRLEDVSLVVRAAGENQFDNGNDNAVPLLFTASTWDGDGVVVVGLGGQSGRCDQVLGGEGLYCGDDDDDAPSGRASMDNALWLRPILENWPGCAVLQQFAAYLLGRAFDTDMGCQALACETRSASCSISSNSKAAARTVHLRSPRSLD